MPSDVARIEAQGDSGFREQFEKNRRANEKRKRGFTLDLIRTVDEKIKAIKKCKLGIGDLKWVGKLIRKKASMKRHPKKKGYGKLVTDDEQRCEELWTLFWSTFDYFLILLPSSSHNYFYLF